MLEELRKRREGLLSSLVRSPLPTYAERKVKLELGGKVS